MHVEERLCKERERRQPSTTKRERPKKKSTFDQYLNLRLLASRAVKKLIYIVKATQRISFTSCYNRPTKLIHRSHPNSRSRGRSG